jgi:hypothetical protein
VAAVHLGQHGADLRSQHPDQRQRQRVGEGDGDAEAARDGGDLGAEEAGADDDEPLDGAQFGAQPQSVAEAAQDVDAAQVMPVGQSRAGVTPVAMTRAS